MSVYQKTLNIFIHLLNTQPDLFTESHRAEIIELLDKEQDDLKSLSNSISAWLKKHPEVNNALFALKVKERSTRAPGSNKANTNIPQYQTDKRTIINAIQQSSSTDKDDDNKNGKA